MGSSIIVLAFKGWCLIAATLIIGASMLMRGRRIEEFGLFPPDIDPPRCELIRGRDWALLLEWKLADLWLGAFFKNQGHGCWSIYICLVPCIPLRLIKYGDWSREGLSGDGK